MDTAKNHEAVQTRNDPRWSAVVDRAAAFDGKFVYVVKSTGIYCRPSCPSRQRALLKAEAKRA
ncbi:MAG: transcriptional regulator, AraC family [Bradyrhizobium sp.]|jgi:AraC family transcriptional regulator of adaptative response/methylated-DNA-[protein]-cysteine methyltransferase|nr:transcriptional regulator, AraC family [Bradyrhizobium sp.]